MLILTNIESTANLLLATGMEAEVVAWNDPLHFGQVVLEGDLLAFSAARATVLASYGWDEDGLMAKDLVLRNQALELAIEMGRQIVFYFGPSVRDQLQLAQLCDHICGCPSETIEKIVLCVSLSPVEASEPPSDFQSGVDDAEKLGQLSFYRDFWRAYAGQDPRFLDRLYRNLEDGILRRAVERVLQSYPSSENCLSIEETQILDAVAQGVTRPQEIFDACQETEDFGHFMNWEFWSILHRMTAGLEPFLKVVDSERFLCPPRDLAWDAFHSQRLSLTEKGERALSPELCFVDSHYPNRWIGGVRLHQNNRWYWDYRDATLVDKPRSKESVLV